MIKIDMEMPKRCVDCPMHHEDTVLMIYCPFVGYMKLEDAMEKRQEFCPMREANCE